MIQPAHTPGADGHGVGAREAAAVLDEHGGAVGADLHDGDGAGVVDHGQADRGRGAGEGELGLACGLTVHEDLDGGGAKLGEREGDGGGIRREEETLPCGGSCGAGQEGPATVASLVLLEEAPAGGEDRLAGLDLEEAVAGQLQGAGVPGAEGEGVGGHVGDLRLPAYVLVEGDLGAGVLGHDVHTGPDAAGERGLEPVGTGAPAAVGPAVHGRGGLDGVAIALEPAGEVEHERA